MNKSKGVSSPSRLSGAGLSRPLVPALIGAMVTGFPSFAYSATSAAARPSDKEERPGLFLPARELQSAKQRLAQGDPWTTAASDWIIEQAKEALKAAAAKEVTWEADEVNRLMHAAVYGATAYRLTDQEEFLALASGVLERMADRFDPRHPFTARSHGLDLSMAVTGWVYAYDLVRAALPATRRKRIEEALLIPAGEALLRQEYGGDGRRLRSNHRTWQNTAVGLLGWTVGRPDWVAWAVDNPDAGFKKQVSISFGGDGLHWEGSPRYQLYTLAAMAHLAEASAQAGSENLWTYRAANGQHMRMMFQGLQSIAESNLRLPNVNARQQETIKDYGSLWEAAYRHTRDPGIGWVLSQTRRTPPDRPWTYVLDALRILGTRPEPVQPPRLDRMRQPSLGWVTLRPGQGAVMGGEDPLYVLVKYSRSDRVDQAHGTAHEHADKGLLEIRAFGQQWVAARSRNSTDDPLYAGFDRQTLAKNTLVVDGRSQPGARGPYDSDGVDGRLEFFEERSLIKVAAVSIPDAYAVGYRRLVAVVGGAADSNGPPPYVIDVFRAADEARHTYDYVLRAGEEAYRFEGDTLGFAPASIGVSTAGYQHLAQLERAVASGPFSLGWSSVSEGFRIHMPDGGRTEVFRARAPSLESGDGFAFFLARRKDVPSAAFLAVLEPYRTKPVLRVAPLSPTPKAGGVRVEGPGSQDIFVAVYEGSAAARAVFPGDAGQWIAINGRYGFIRMEQGRIHAYGDVTEARLRVAGPVREAFHNDAPARVNVEKGFARIRPKT